MSVLVVAAHPDDEILGCGGTISKLSKEGYQVNILFISDMPFEIDGIIIDLCEIDLSPGISIFPFKPSLILFDII